MTAAASSAAAAVSAAVGKNLFLYIFKIYRFIAAVGKN
jgi:hypothetical protein